MAVLLNYTVLLVRGQTGKSQADFPFFNTDLPLNLRVDDLVSRMTTEEKILQLQHTAPAIERLGIPQYNWWNECLHGVARNGIATVFPQAIGMAATFNPELIQQEADVISTEGRAKYYEAVSKGQHDIYQGLTFWSPNINIFRDPRWGRGQETYGEDPFLTGSIGVAFVKGLQGNDPDYYKVIATAKHFAVHSGPESQRHKFDAWPSQRDLYETYLPAFEMLVKDAGVYSVMSCYNRVYGTPSSASSFLFDKTLRGKWGFKGYVVSDCWAISDMYSFHSFVPNAEKAASLSIKAGTDLSCGPEYGALLKALELGYVTEYDINTSLKRLFEARFKLGLFDPASKVKYASISSKEYDTDSHRALSLKVAQQSIVLLKNDLIESIGKAVLPLHSKTKSIAVIGPYANDTAVLLGNYNGVPSHPVTLLEGIRAKAGKKIKVSFCAGVEKPEIQALRNQSESIENSPQFTDAIALAQKADVVIFAGGISPNLEGEEMKVQVPGFYEGDRTTMDLPQNQQLLLEKLKSTGKPIVLVLTNGSALSVNWASENIPAIIEAWYPGQEGGNAVADVIFGDYNPAGRLPVTFYKSVDDLSAFEDYSMKGRTYKYFTGTPLYAFGYGLSFTSFDYKKALVQNPVLSKSDSISLSVTLINTGKYDGDEVIQIYIKQPGDVNDKPIKSLIAFERINFLKGETKDVVFSIPVSRLRQYNSEISDYSISEGSYEILIGSSSDNIKLKCAIIIKVTNRPL
jgi:beta-glucosidase